MKGSVLVLVLATLAAPALAQSSAAQARADAELLRDCVVRKQGPEGDLMAARRAGVVFSEEMKKAIAESGDAKDCIGLISGPCEANGGKACETREARGWEQAIRDTRNAAMKSISAVRAAALAKSARAHAARLCAATDRGGKDGCIAARLGEEFISIAESNRL